MPAGTVPPGKASEYANVLGMRRDVAMAADQPITHINNPKTCYSPALGDVDTFDGLGRPVACAAAV